MTYKIGIDVGGTFTDFLLVNENGDSKIYKVLSTPNDPSIGVFNGLHEMAENRDVGISEFLKEVERIVHGTTVTTNAVLTNSISKTGLLTTRGFRDTLQMRRGIREELYNNKYQPPLPIVPRHLRLPVTERVDVEGTILKEIDLDDIRAAITTFNRQGVKAVAICFMHSYANTSNEHVAAKMIKNDMSDVYLTVSSELLPQIRFYERTSTTVLNSCVGPILKDYLQNLTLRLSQSLFDGILLIMQSNGGVTSPDIAQEVAASTLLSGPAAAPVAGIAYTSTQEYESFITVDMGGTSFDATLVENRKPFVTTEGKVNFNALALPMMAIHTIGAGGGSIGWIDEGGLLRMGPKSAGASPGPVCYMKGGGEPTCTDADLVLGYLNPDFFAGGKIKLDMKRAKDAINEKIAKPLRLSLVEAAYGMYHVINVNMASAIREITIKRGYDPREFLLVCAGGAGPIHAAMIALELEIPKILIPKESSIFCAAGMLFSDLKHDYVRTYHTVFSRDAADINRLIHLVKEMEDEGHAILKKEKIPQNNHLIEYSFDMRYLGQYHEVNIKVDKRHIWEFDNKGVSDIFHFEHDRLYGYSLRKEGTPIELVNIRVTAIGITEKPALQEESHQDTDVIRHLKGSRRAYLPSERDYREVNIYDGMKMGYGNHLAGPVIIEQVNTTIFVPPEYTVDCDAYGSYILSLK
jgi:N-methylhydantoinase A